MTSSARRSPAPTPNRSRTRSLLAERRFRTLFIAHLVSNLGDWLAFLALFGLSALEWHASSTRLAFLAVAYIVPLALVAPLAGVLVDRSDLKHVLVGGDLLRAGLVVGMAWSTNYFFLVGLLFLHQSIGCFFNAAQSAALPRLVDRERLLAANAWTTSAANASKLIGPAIAGCLVAAFGARSCFVADAVSFAISGIALATLPAMPAIRPGSAADGRSGWIPEMGAGIVHLWQARPVRQAVLLVLWAMAPLGAFLAVLAAFVRDRLGSGPRELGMLLSTLGAGTVLGALLVARTAALRPRTQLMGAGLALQALALAALAVCHGIVFASLGMFVLGMGTAAMLVPAQACLQEETPRALLGRVTSLAVAAIGILQAASMALAGPASTACGFAPFLCFASTWLVVGSVLAWIVAPAPASLPSNAS